MISTQEPSGKPGQAPLFPQVARVLKINELETITDDVIEAAASTLVIGT